MTKSKTTVHYINRASTRFCQNCEHYIHPNRCHIVRGHIYPHGSCDIFESD